MQSDQTEHADLGLIWGAKNIGAVIGRSERQTKHALSKGELPSRKINGRWVASRSALERFFSEVAA